jgi:hypothetical protein
MIPFGTEAELPISVDMNCISQITTWLVTFHIRRNSSCSFGAEECLMVSERMKCVRNFAFCMIYFFKAPDFQGWSTAALSAKWSNFDRAIRLQVNSLSRSSGLWREIVLLAPGRSLLIGDAIWCWVQLANCTLWLGCLSGVHIVHERLCVP